MLSFTQHAPWPTTAWGSSQRARTYLHKTAGLLSDPAHVTGELLFDGLETAVAFAIAWVLGRRALRREHYRLDKEHGVIDHGVTTAASQQGHLEWATADEQQCHSDEQQCHSRLPAI